MNGLKRIHIFHRSSKALILIGAILFALAAVSNIGWLTIPAFIFVYTGLLKSKKEYNF